MSARGVQVAGAVALGALILVAWPVSGVAPGYAQQVVLGIASGAVYALLALAIVLTFRSTGLVNFAQGEFAVMSAFIAWSLLQRFGSGTAEVWAALVLSAAASFVVGVCLEVSIIRRLAHGSILSASVVLLALFIAVNGLLEWRYTSTPRPFPSPFAERAVGLGEVTIGLHSIGTVAVVALLLALLILVFRTKLGLALRAVAEDPLAARLTGVPAGRLLALGWGLATAIGAVAGVLIAYTLSLSTGMMFNVLLFALAAAILGGLNSPTGAVAGGLLVGVAQNVVGVTSFLGGTQLRLPWAFLLILVVLLIRPHGLFGRAPARRL